MFRCWMASAEPAACCSLRRPGVCRWGDAAFVERKPLGKVLRGLSRICVFPGASPLRGKGAGVVFRQKPDRHTCYKGVKLLAASVDVSGKEGWSGVRAWGEPYPPSQESTAGRRAEHLMRSIPSLIVVG